MNLNPIVATARNAQVLIALKGGFSGWLPIPAIWSGFPTSPEVALISRVASSKQFIFACATAANLVFVERVKGGFAHLARPVGSGFISPSRREIALPAAVGSVAIGWGLIKTLFAVCALFFLACFSCIHAAILPLKRSYWELATRNLRDARETQASGLFADMEELESA